MRVFVIGTGRCGSVSFREACRYVTNYTSGHESKCGLLEYPDNWIEVNPHLRCCIKSVAEKYPEAYWVHLIREPQPCIDSLAALDKGDVMRAYEKLYGSVTPSSQPGDIAYRYYWAETDAIDVQLKAIVPGERRLKIHLDSISHEWINFWNWIGAEGNYKASLAAWDVKRNTREERGET